MFPANAEDEAFKALLSLRRDLMAAIRQRDTEAIAERIYLKWSGAMMSMGMSPDRAELVSDLRELLRDPGEPDGGTDLIKRALNFTPLGKGLLCVQHKEGAPVLLVRKGDSIVAGYMAPVFGRVNGRWVLLQDAD